MSNKSKKNAKTFNLGLIEYGVYGIIAICMLIKCMRRVRKKFAILEDGIGLDKEVNSKV
ncbi:MAG: hypothetical protein MJZ25_04165 [Fibrobacter sp.]|nr:hypothetical protein [Fibrobacter sp.]